MRGSRRCDLTASGPRKIIGRSNTAIYYLLGQKTQRCGAIKDISSNCLPLLGRYVWTKTVNQNWGIAVKSVGWCRHYSSGGSFSSTGNSDRGCKFGVANLPGSGAGGCAAAVGADAVDS